MPHALLRLAVAVLPMFGAASGTCAPQQEATRGELLYRTHCIACHTTQMHWRDGHRATDWASLLALVTQWQARSGLAWDADDTEEVVRWLNTTIYGFPRHERRG